jgi:hypothetical protein
MYCADASEMENCKKLNSVLCVVVYSVYRDANRANAVIKSVAIYFAARITKRRKAAQVLAR